MNDKRIQEVIEIEKQADSIRENALKEAQQIPIEAEQEAQALIDKSRAEAEQEAHRLVAEARSEAESQRILSEAEDKIKRTDSLAKSNFDRAVTYVLSRIVGKG